MRKYKIKKKTFPWTATESYMVKRRVYKYLPMWRSVGWDSTKLPILFRTYQEALEFINFLEEEKE